jgi:hypothetical protein
MPFCVSLGKIPHDERRHQLWLLGKALHLELHVSVDHDGYLPTLVTMTEGRVADLTEARTLALPPGSIVVFDRGYTDYGWYNKLDNQGISFVTRLKRNARITVAERRTVNKKSGLTCDQTIYLTGTKATACPIALRRIGYKDPETGKHYFFLTNNFHLAAKTITELYKVR